MVSVIPYLKASMLFNISVISADSIKLSPVRKEKLKMLLSHLQIYIFSLRQIKLQGKLLIVSVVFNNMFRHIGRFHKKSRTGKSRPRKLKQNKFAIVAFLNAYILCIFSGWHHRLNSKAGMSGLGFYRLVPLLRREATLIEIALRGSDLQRDRRGVHRRLETRLEEYWTRYMDHEITTTAFLRACGSLYGVRSTAQGHDDEQ